VQWLLLHSAGELHLILAVRADHEAHTKVPVQGRVAGGSCGWRARTGQSRACIENDEVPSYALFQKQLPLRLRSCSGVGVEILGSRASHRQLLSRN